MTGVPTRLNGDVRDLYALVIEPAWRRDVDLLVEADRGLDDILRDELVEPDFGYAWTLGRLGYIVARYHRRDRGGLPAMTPIEQRLYEAMRAAHLAPRVQYGINGFRVDFAFPELSLAVEADGRAWHDADRDERRDRKLRARGWEVVRFSGSEIVRDSPGCASSVVGAYSRRRSQIRRTIDSRSPAMEPWWRRVLLWLKARARRSEQISSVAIELPDTREDSIWLECLDEFQRAAVRGHDGVVQVIAPAGSGKTRVIVARVQELRSRGAAANRILCCTFNKDAVAELKRRLGDVNEMQVEVRGFHGLGWKILEAAGDTRGDVRATTYAEWRLLAREAMRATRDGVWIDPIAAQNSVSRFKLSQLRSPEEAEAALDERPSATSFQRTEVELYRRHERFLETQNRFDFDDLIFRAVTILRLDPAAREHWQRRFDHVLVDEYQDIELAQERLVQILAAPQDGLFCVGDEDQCIYAWRRASVERIIDLDQLYPGLERHSLPVNYRCGRRIVEASRALIEHNEHRFAKTISAAPSQHEGEVVVIAATSLDAQVREVARRAETAAHDDLVVLARTTNVLRQAAVAFARRGIVIDAPEAVVSNSGANGLLVTYLRVFSDLSLARADDISRVFRVPNRYLPDDAAEAVAARLRAGKPFAEALVGADRGEEWRIEKLAEAAVFFDGLAGVSTADDFVRLVRTEGGLDRHYAEQQQLTPSDQSAIDALENAERQAEGLSVSEFVDVLDHETQLIKAHINAADGVELKTIHGAKGREWSTVYLVGTDDGELPHHLSTRADGHSEIEDERRLAYVAMTRAKDRLVIMCTQGKASRFIREAALSPDVLRDGSNAASPAPL